MTKGLEGPFYEGVLEESKVDLTNPTRREGM